MEGLEEKLGAILKDPGMMQKIMTMAQSLGGTPSQPAPQPEKSPAADIDLSMLQKLAGLTRQSGIDKEQQALLHALHPYLSRQRIHKLENAMRAARMARFAAAALSQSGGELFPGR